MNNMGLKWLGRPEAASPSSWVVGCFSLAENGPSQRRDEFLVSTAKMEAGLIIWMRMVTTLASARSIL
jgi:hypothetical protein